MSRGVVSYVLSRATVRPVRMTVIADDAGPEAIGGIIGGEHAGCSPKTVNVFLEAAYFDPLRTAAIPLRTAASSSTMSGRSSRLRLSI